MGHRVSCVKVSCSKRFCHCLSKALVLSSYPCYFFSVASISSTVYRQACFGFLLQSRQICISIAARRNMQASVCFARRKVSVRSNTWWREVGEHGLLIEHGERAVQIPKNDRHHNSISNREVCSCHAEVRVI
jgi:hypothetical protein